MTRQRLIFRVSLMLASGALTPVLVAQESDLPDEGFLLFLAAGMEVGGEWQDPMTLASLAELNEVPSDELVWVAEQDDEVFETISNEVIDGEDDE